MRNLSLAIVLTVGLVLGTAACGGSDSDTDTNAVKTELVDGLGLSDDQAQCVVDELGGDASVILELTDPDFVPSEDDLVALDRAGDECDLE